VNSASGDGVSIRQPDVDWLSAENEALLLEGNKKPAKPPQEVWCGHVGSKFALDLGAAISPKTFFLDQYRHPGELQFQECAPKEIELWAAIDDRKARVEIEKEARRLFAGSYSGPPFPSAVLLGRFTYNLKLFAQQGWDVPIMIHNHRRASTHEISIVLTSTQGYCKKETCLGRVGLHAHDHKPRPERPTSRFGLAIWASIVLGIFVILCSVVLASMCWKGVSVVGIGQRSDQHGERKIYHGPTRSSRTRDNEQRLEKGQKASSSWAKLFNALVDRGRGAKTSTTPPQNGPEMKQVKPEVGKSIGDPNPGTTNGSEAKPSDDTGGWTQERAEDETHKVPIKHEGSANTFTDTSKSD
jgi:hypothetical protein